MRMHLLHGVSAAISSSICVTFFFFFFSLFTSESINITTLMKLNLSRVVPSITQKGEQSGLERGLMKDRFTRIHLTKRMG